jgi:hypothetical protein
MATRYQRCNQNPYIKEEQTTQWPQDILITSLVSCGHCVVCSSLINGFWLHLWYLVAIVLSVLLWYTDSDYIFGILWPLCCLSFFDIQILITSLVSCGHWVVCPSLIYRFWLHLWHLVVIVLSVLLRYTDSDSTFGILWPLCCLFFLRIRLSKRNRQHNGQRKKYKRTNNDLQNIHITHSWLITGCVTILTRRVSLMEQELFTFPEHLSPPSVFSMVSVTRSLVLCVCFVDHCLSFCTFSFGH